MTQSDESVGRDAYKQLCQGLDEAQRQPKEECQLRQVSSLLVFVHEGHWHRCLTEYDTRVCALREHTVIPTCFPPDASIGLSSHTIRQKNLCELKSMCVCVCVLVHVCERADVQECVECHQIKLVKHFFLPVTEYIFSASTSRR